MKPFFGIDITTDENNETMNFEEFVVQKPSKEAARKNEQAAEEALEELKAYFKSYGKRLNFLIAAFFFGCVGAVLLLVFLSSLQLGKPDASDFGVLAVGSACAIATVVCAVVSHRINPDRVPADDGDENDGQKDDGQKDDGDEDDETPCATVAEIFGELGVPREAKWVDVLGFRYVDKRGRFRPRGETGYNGKLIYSVYSLKGYAENGQLRLADAEGVVAIPLNEIKAIRTVRKRVLLLDWTKKRPCTHEIYKPYKLKMVKSRAGEWLSVGWYHVLEFTHKHESWGVWFPNYELPAFESLTGLKADEESTDYKEIFTSEQTI
ncbi:MAG: hypothetical protein J6Z13_00750 [Clostridia bacterium]|nr:hypothetical protein [Clostridia bacterium]